MGILACSLTPLSNSETIPIKLPTNQVLVPKIIDYKRSFLRRNGSELISSACPQGGLGNPRQEK